ncbi:hypothetical protein FRC03_009095 [Tulasnella sp. 419]|nr:hypothetical protein FRC03_009095 [Tulasnella sp. 419]
MSSLSLVSLIKQPPLFSSAAQSNTLEISWTLPIITMKFTSILSISFILVGWLFTPVLGGNCSGIGCYVCGKAVNRTRWTMTITTNPSDAKKCPNTDGSHPNCCNVLNWKGPFGNPNSVFNTICKWQSLAAGKSAGGNTCGTRFDVDAFTFADRAWIYHTGGRDYSMYGADWLKINDLQTATCTEKNGKPYCTIS